MTEENDTFALWESVFISISPVTVKAKTGFQDAFMVIGELYHNWIIEDPYIVKRASLFKDKP